MKQTNIAEGDAMNFSSPLPNPPPDQHFEQAKRSPERSVARSEGSGLCWVSRRACHVSTGDTG